MIKNYKELSIRELHNALINKEITPLELTKLALEEAKNDNNNAIEYLMEKEALEMAASLIEPEKDNMFWGIPIAIKDNFSTKDVPTTGSSNILNGYVPVYDAQVVTLLKQKHAIPIAKVTLDELAMGGTGTSGHLGTTYNPYCKHKKRLMGGSSCGSAAFVTAGIVPFALGSDTGDSTRKPASYGGIVGFKPTWSRISRYGLFPFAPSLDTVGIFTRSVEDASFALEVLAGHDEKDATSSFKEVDKYSEHLEDDIKGYKVAIIQEILDSITNETIKNAFLESVKKLEDRGVKVGYVHMDNELLTSLFPTYFVISCAEATSNNANLDGIKFGPYHDGKTYQEVMANARTIGFSELIKRRFVFGSFALMKENQHDLFLRAQRNRRRIVEETNKILEQYDFIYLPAAPSVAPKIGEKSDRLSNEYLIADNHLVIGNFAGLPSISLPIGYEGHLPFDANISGRPFEESKLLNIANFIEKDTHLKGIYAKKEGE